MAKAESQIAGFAVMGYGDAMGTSPTIEDIAQAAGVSSDTVSRVLNGHHKGTYAKVNAKAEDIRALAVRMGYRPRAGMHSRRGTTAGAMAWLIPSSQAGVYVPTGLFRGASIALRQLGKHLLVAQPDEDELANHPRLLRLWHDLAVEGLICSHHLDVPHSMRQGLQRARIPTVWVNDLREADCVMPDDRGAAYRATKACVDMGHRRIAYVVFASGVHISLVHREEGYRQAMIEAGLPVRMVRESYISVLITESFDHRLEQCAALLRAEDAPTACICYGNHEPGVLVTASAMIGKRVGRDVAVIGFSDKPLEDSGIPVSTWLFPGRELGQAAVHLIERRRRHMQHGEPPVIVPYAEKPVGLTMVPPPLKVSP